MTAGERFRNWIDEVAQRWADRLRGWLVSWLMKSVKDTFEDLELKPRQELTPIIDEIIASPNTPPTIKPLFEKIRAHESPAWLTTILIAVAMMVGGTVIAQFAPTLGELRYAAERLAKLYRLDPMNVITAWRRDPEKYAGLFDDLKDQGWTDERIEALKFFTQFYPAPADLIRWQAREVFEPEMIARYGLDDEFEAIDKAPFYKAGMTDEQILNYWRAHWEHASWMQVVEMLHRGLLTEEQARDWFRVVEIPPFWRQMLIDSAYTWPTRVDVRRWWDMRTIDETELRRLYSGMGYRGINLDNYVLWTKVYVAFPDLVARWKNGWITLDEVTAELTGLGMPAARVDEMIETKIKTATPERTAKERDITKTDIIKGVKTGVIARGEGVELLLDMGYDEDEAVYILEINIPLDEEEVVVRQRELTKADILKGLKTEVITRDQARVRLLDLRYSPADAEFLLKVYDAQVKPPVEPREREASKADIIAAVKKGLITPEDAYLMLQDINFTPEAAAFILEVKAEVSPFSPINFAEFKERSQKYRLAAGMEAKPMPEEIKTAAALVVKLTGERDALTRSIEEEKRGLIDQEIIPEETTRRLKSLQVKRNRAESKLSAAKSEYERLVAEWKHEIS